MQIQAQQAAAAQAAQQHAPFAVSLRQASPGGSPPPLSALAAAATVDDIAAAVEPTLKSLSRSSSRELLAGAADGGRLSTDAPFRRPPPLPPNAALPHVFDAQSVGAGGVVPAAHPGALQSAEAGGGYGPPLPPLGAEMRGDAQVYHTGTGQSYAGLNSGWVTTTVIGGGGGRPGAVPGVPRGAAPPLSELAAAAADPTLTYQGQGLLGAAAPGYAQHESSMGGAVVTLTGRDLGVQRHGTEACSGVRCGCGGVGVKRPRGTSGSLL